MFKFAKIGRINLQLRLNLNDWEKTRHGHFTKTVDGSKYRVYFSKIKVKFEIYIGDRYHTLKSIYCKDLPIDNWHVHGFIL